MSEDSSTTSVLIEVTVDELFSLQDGALKSPESIAAMTVQEDVDVARGKYISAGGQRDRNYGDTGVLHRRRIGVAWGLTQRPDAVAL